ncbi:MAG: ABC transporter permease [Spirochaetales bacterium]|nr:ABC transporter permease [Spirochaetales bacterium]MCF7937402.1 ABC transporter permease [Spirochaetales bacterium]
MAETGLLKTTDTQKKKTREFFQLLLGHGMGKTGIIIIIIFLVMAFFSPLLWTNDPYKSGEAKDILVKPSAEFWLGTDDMGKDVWSQVVYGARVSIMIGFIAAVITVVTGAFVGIVAGFFGGKLEEGLMRIVDFFMMLPILPLMIVLAAVLGPSIWNIVFVISVVSWPTTARVVRSQVLSLKERPFIEAARCIGAPNKRIMFREILPNVVPLLFAQSILMITETIYAESVLSFLGLGDASKISWGQMLHFAFESGAMSNSPWWVIPPILSIVLLIVSFSFLGTAVSDVLTPGYKEKRGY